MKSFTLAILLIALFNTVAPSVADADGWFTPTWSVERPSAFQPNDLVADFVVVGSGAGGSAFARGVLDGGFSVIVCEAGDNYVGVEDVWNPLKTSVMYSTKSNKYGWQLKTEVDPVIGKAIYVNTGRLFGGSTSHNGMQYVRGSKGYFDQWESYGGSNWETADILDAYTRMEKFIDEATNTTLPGRGSSGKVDVRRPAPGPSTGAGSLANKLAEWSYESSGIPITPDYNGASQPYGSFPRYDIFETPSRTRTSAATAFLGSSVVNADGTAVNGRRIKLFFKTTVVRVLFDKKKRAVGVDAVRMGIPVRIWARKEVVLAANFQSATLLQTSGIGDGDALLSMGVPLIYDNPNVGLNWANHPLAVLVFFTSSSYGGINTDQDPKGLYAGGGFYPDVNEDGDFEPVDLTKPRAFQTIWQGAGVPGIAIMLAQMVNPVSSGKILIQSNDPLHNPSIAEGIYSNNDDLESFARFLYHFVQNNLTDYMHAQNAGNFGTWPRWNTVADTKAWLKANPNEGSHFTSSNRMAPSAQLGVVDWAGRVFGVGGLRVADTSIIPFIADGNTAAMGMMIGMRLAEFAKVQNS